MPPIDWDALARKVGVAAAKIGKRVAERGVDGALEDLDHVLLEGRRRVKQARSRIDKPPAPPPVEDDTPAPAKKVVVDATLEDDG